MTRAELEERWNKYNAVLSKMSYRAIYDAAWNARFKTLLSPEVKVTYTGYSVINFCDSVGCYTLHTADSGLKYILQKRVLLSFKGPYGNTFTFPFYVSHEPKDYANCIHKEDWDEHTQFTDYMEGGRPVKFCLLDAITIDVPEDNHNAVLTAIKYNVPLSEARKQIYGK